MIELPVGVLANFKDDGLQATIYPADGAMLKREIGTLIGVVGMNKYVLHLLETDSTFWIAAKGAAFSRIKVESHEV